MQIVIITVSCNEFTYQNFYVNKTTKPEDRKSASTQCFMGLNSDKANA